MSDEITRPDHHFRWWTEPRNVAELIRYLDAKCDLSVDRFALLREVLDIVEEPWKWSEEFDAMVRSQRASQRPTADVLEDDRKVG